MLLNDLRRPMRLHHLIASLFALLIAVFSLTASAEQEEERAGQSPLRLSFMEGEASFWRPGAEDWAPARLNTPLAAGDELYTGDRANLELQIGARAFVRAGERTQLGLVNQEPDFLQLKVTTGRVSLDLRALPQGYTVELDTPNAVFAIEYTGYYRVEVVGDTTHFITRRGGRATVTAAGGEAENISPSEEIVVIGRDAPRVETYVAPEIDDWDRWNYARTDHQIEAVSNRYLPPGVYGADELDHYGNWRVLPSYGPVWVPYQTAPDWVPYSTGSWVWDPYYGWTWIDDAPWGWAPYHYGRWVFIDGFWGWAPGPVVARPVYAPALVAFFGFGHGVSVRIGFGVPGVGWVALGWGEPLVPWWGPAGFIGTPWWGGWGGPRIVNNVVISRTTVVNVTNITYQNTKVSNAVIAVRVEHFGRGAVRERISVAQAGERAPVMGEHPVKPVPASLVAGRGATIRPPDAAISRPVAATRRPPEPRLPWRGEDRKAKAAVSVPEPKIVSHPKAPGVAEVRPPFGAQEGPERPRRPLPPRFEEMKPPEGLPAQQRRAPAREKRLPAKAASPEAVPPVPRAAAPRKERAPEALRDRAREEPARPAPRVAPQAETRREGPRGQEPRVLPGKPANRLYPKHEPQAGEKRP